MRCVPSCVGCGMGGMPLLPFSWVNTFYTFWAEVFLGIYWSVMDLLLQSGSLMGRAAVGQLCGLRCGWLTAAVSSF